ncbi:hypothetical protein WJX73_007820 [Symbiochloris irregularis]|uniref:Uncharacterized protein n=1 Tax=Symbiochloris irregularis TaxID=706552 RepID=A0AAW1NMH9_9CHLO
MPSLATAATLSSTGGTGKRRLATLERGGASDATGGITTLIEAVQNGQAQAVTRLKDRAPGLDVDAHDDCGRTALMWAAEIGSVEMVECLLSFGAKADVKDSRFARTAMHFAARAGHADALKTLCAGLSASQRQALACAPDIYGMSALYLAKQQQGDGGQAALAYLLQCGALLDQPLLKPSKKELEAQQPKAGT